MKTGKNHPYWKSIFKTILIAGMAVVIPAGSLVAQEYQSLEIINIKPEEILPIIGQVEAGDYDVYKHIEHLRIAEATRVRDMMWQYGAGKYSTEEYQQLMSRLNTGMIQEWPKGYNNYEALGGVRESSYHAHNEWHILNTLVNHANFKISDGELYKHLYNLAKNNPNSINLFGKSVYTCLDKDYYPEWEISENIKNVLKPKNLIIFHAGTNIRKEGNPKTLKNKVYQKDISTNDTYGMYCEASAANGKNDNSIDRHMLVTIGTNSTGDIDQTNQTAESSKFPVGFHDKVLFAGRAFPYINGASGKIDGDAGKYATSYPNYVNVAIADILFQLKADVPDVDEFLEMVRSTCLTDYIRFDLNGDGDTNDNHNGQPETQPLQLMNPAGFFIKYLMPLALPASIKLGEAAVLEKGYYHGVVFNIPGAEVLIDGQWIAFDKKNNAAIKAQNPMTLEWRLNGELLNKYGYKPGDTVKGQILVVDDQWNGLTITKDFSVSLEAGGPDAINSTVLGTTAETWYTIDGLRLDTKPAKPGVYVVDGKKVIIK